MDADLEAMRSIQRYKSCVECLLEPLLKKRRLWQMPCKHRRTFELRKAARQRHYEERGLDDPGDDQGDEMLEGYCDCIPFNRRVALWEFGDLCVKYGLTRTQMRELAAILLVITTDIFTYNHAKRAMHNMFQGEFKNYLKAYKRKREEGISFEDAMAGLVPRWQFRMMPNC
jgi:hypothetical protein